MKPSVKFGLIVGFCALFVNIFVTLFTGVCAPLVSMLAGVAAAFLTLEEETPATASDGAKHGLIAGLISGVLSSVAFLCGTATAVAISIPLLIGSMNASPEDFLAATSLPLIAGAATVVFAIGSILLAVVGGAATGYLRAQNMVKSTQSGLQ